MNTAAYPIRRLMKHYLFWAEWKKPHRRIQTQLSDSTVKDAPCVEKKADAKKQKYECGAPPGAIMLLVLMIGAPVFISYDVFTAPNRRLEMDRSAVINNKPVDRDENNQTKYASGVRENPVDVGCRDDIVTLGVKDGQHSDEHGLGGSNGSKGELPPRTLSVTEPPCFFGTAMLGGLVIRWDCTFVGWSVPEETPSLSDSANENGKSRLAPNL